MSREATRWTPAHWPAGKLKMYRKHVLRHAWFALYDLLGPHEGAIKSAELRAWFDGVISRDALKALGVRTPSDDTDLGPSPKPE